jgi:hypothetical protein
MSKFILFTIMCLATNTYAAEPAKHKVGDKVSYYSEDTYLVHDCKVLRESDAYSDKTAYVLSCVGLEGDFGDNEIIATEFELKNGAHVKASGKAKGREVAMKQEVKNYRKRQVEAVKNIKAFIKETEQ